MTAQHEPNRAVHQRDHQIGIRFAGNAEDMNDSFGLKAANEQIECLPACFPVPQSLLFYRANVGVTKASVSSRRLYP